MEARVVGCEAELGLALEHEFRDLSTGSIQTEWSHNGAGYAVSTVLREYMDDTVLRHGAHAGGNASGHFYVNGSLIYVDIGEHPEVASAESPNIRDVVASHVGGLVMVHAGFSRAYKANALRRPYALFNRVVSDESSWGFHENYLVSREIAPGSGEGYIGGVRILRPLAVFLAVRSPLSGVGSLYNGNFKLSQKTTRVFCEFSTDTTREKPLINRRDQPHANPEKYARLHVPSGDPTTPHILYRTLGLTSLAARMIEQRRAPRIYGEGLQWAEVARRVAGDITMTERYNGRTVLDVQESFFEVMSEMVRQGVPDQEADAFRRSVDAHNTLRGVQAYAKEYKDEPDIEQIVGEYIVEHVAGTNQFDWAERLKYIRQFSPDDRDSADRSFDTISKAGVPKSYYWQRIQTPESRACIPLELIKERRRSPPPGRAQDRAAFIEQFASQPGVHVDWHYLSYRGDKTRELVRLDLGEPAGRNPEFADFCRRVKDAIARNESAQSRASALADGYAL